MHKQILAALVTVGNNLAQSFVQVLFVVLRAIFGTSREREIKRLEPTMKAVRAHEARCVQMSNDELRAQTGIFKERLAAGETLPHVEGNREASQGVPVGVYYDRLKRIRLARWGAGK